ncbi:MAG: hypothetical protein HOH74_08400, partial [Gemmatimonadetes bacterium]|nr:hypothetical protein [Gemmatimonadota bacterium]
TTRSARRARGHAAAASASAASSSAGTPGGGRRRAAAVAAAAEQGEQEEEEEEEGQASPTPYGSSVRRFRHARVIETELAATQSEASELREALEEASQRMVQLERRLVLNERGLLTETRVTNDGCAPLPLVWYAHPFLPWPQDGICGSFSFAMTLPDNPGFAVDGENQIVRIADHDWGEKGQFVQIEGCAGKELRARYHHPVTGNLLVISDFKMSQMPIWGNDCTVSFEPFMEHDLAPATTVSWSLVYSF